MKKRCKFIGIGIVVVIVAIGIIFKIYGVKSTITSTPFNQDYFSNTAFVQWFTEEMKYEILVKAEEAKGEMLMPPASLNRDYFGKETYGQWFTKEIKQEIFLKSEEVKGEFQEVVDTDSVFPRGLIIEVEKILYQSLDEDMNRYIYSQDGDYTSLYMEATNRMGAEKHSLELEDMVRHFPELADRDIGTRWEAYRRVMKDENVIELFHIPSEGAENHYLCVRSYGGNNGACFVQVLQWTGEEFQALHDFDVQNSGWARVIFYEGVYYYIFLQYNYDSKNYDGIRLHRLDRKSQEETLLIRYLPYEYVWEMLYENKDDEEICFMLEDYLEEIREELSSPRYLEQGRDGGGYVFMGDEKKAECPKNWETGATDIDTWYQVDFTNTDTPILFRRTRFEPSNTWNVHHLRTYFFYENEKTEQSIELEEMGTGQQSPVKEELILVQLWFKELGGSVYTFGLYRVSDYNYLLNVSLIEGEKVMRIRTDILVPRRYFECSNQIYKNM